MSCAHKTNQGALKISLCLEVKGYLASGWKRETASLPAARLRWSESHQDISTLCVQLVDQKGAGKGWQNPSGAGQEDRERGETFGTLGGSWQERTCGSSLLSSPACPLLPPQLTTVPAPCCMSHPPPPPLHARHGEKRVPHQHFPDPLFSLPSSLADPLPQGFDFFKDSARLRARPRHNR